MRDRAALDELRAELIASAEPLAEMFYGKASSRARGVLRFGNKGSAKVTVAGPQRGAWVDFEAGAAGGMLDMIRHHRGVSLADAIRWAETWIGSHGRAARNEPQRHAGRVERDAREEADRQNRIGTARALWIDREPIADTVAEAYLRHRGIETPAGGWPASGAFHPATCSLILVATLADGTVQAVQRVLLTAEGRKVDALPGHPAKRSHGVMDGAVVRLPGDPNGPLQLAEGPETGLSVWIATGSETWITLGTMAKVQPPTGRVTIVCRDDDKANSPADHRIRKAAQAWTLAGHDVKLALPWPERRHDGSDFNDTLQEAGPDAVRARIAEALGPRPPAPKDRRPIREAQEILTAVAGGFFDRVLEHDPADDMPLPVDAVRVSVGAGKSFAARQAAASFLARARTRGDTRNVAFLVPRHELGAEAAIEFEAVPAARAAKLSAAIWRGREAADPETPGRQMCRDLEAVKAAQEANQNVQTGCCSGKDADGARAMCQFFWTCGYQRQRAQKADVWFLAHESLFHEKPATIGKLAAVIVDESMWQTGLDGAQGHPIALPLDALTGDCTLPGDPLASQRLGYLRSAMFDALRISPDGALTRAAALASGLNAGSAAEARTLEWRRKVNPGMCPGMPLDARKAAARAAAVNRSIARMALFWRAVEALLHADGPAASGWIELLVLDTPEGGARGLHLRWRKPIADGWRAPTLVIDAILNVDLLRPYWPGVTLAADVEAETPHQHVIQVVGRSEAKSRFLAQDGEPEGRHDHNGRDLVAKLAKIGRHYADMSAQTLAVVQKDIRAALPSFGVLPATIDVRHHNSVAGLDRWKRSPALVCVGRTLPAPNAVARIAEALTGKAVDRLTGWYPKAQGWREMVVGTHQAVQVDCHPDPAAEAVRWQICEGELLQVVGRVRGCNRSEVDPVDVWLFGETAIPLPVAAVVAAADLDPSPADRMLGLKGIALQNAKDVADAFPDLWGNREAAKKALARGQLGTNSAYKFISGVCPQLDDGEQLRLIEYQRAGARLSRASAVYDCSVVPDPVALLAELLGPLAWNSITEAPAEPQPRPSPSAEGPTVPLDPPPDRVELPPVDESDPGWAPDACVAPR